MGNSLDKVLPGLYVGGIRASSKESILNNNGITHILSIHDRPAAVFKDRQYLCIPAHDNSSQDLTQFFSQCNDFIHQARLNGGSVLVHCIAGMSRSVTITAAYIMTVTSLSWRDSLNSIRGARRCANPNFGFQRQLITFYHDHIETEKARLFAKFPKKLDTNDIEECKRLIAVHREFVLYGEDGRPKNLSAEDDPDLYPIAHDAYQVKESDTEGSSKVSKKADPLDADGDDDDKDESYIDMTKNSFKKTGVPGSPVEMVVRKEADLQEDENNTGGREGLGSEIGKHEVQSESSVQSESGKHCGIKCEKENETVDKSETDGQKDYRDEVIDCKENTEGSKNNKQNENEQRDLGKVNEGAKQKETEKLWDDREPSKGKKQTETVEHSADVKQSEIKRQNKTVKKIETAEQHCKSAKQNEAFQENYELLTADNQIDNGLTSSSALDKCKVSRNNDKGNIDTDNKNKIVSTDQNKFTEATIDAFFQGDTRKPQIEKTGQWSDSSEEDLNEVTQSWQQGVGGSVSLPEKTHPLSCSEDLTDEGLVERMFEEGISRGAQKVPN